MTSFPVSEAIIATQTKSNFKESKKIPLSKMLKGIKNALTKRAPKAREVFLCLRKMHSIINLNQSDNMK